MSDYEEGADEVGGLGGDLMGRIACGALDDGSEGTGKIVSRLDVAAVVQLTGHTLSELMRRVKLDGKENKKVRQAARTAIQMIDEMFDNKPITARCRLSRSDGGGWHCHVLEVVLP